MANSRNKHSDAYRVGAIGKHGREILGELHTKNGKFLSASEIAENTAVSTTTVYARLKELSQAGFIVTNGQKRNRKYALLEPLTDELLERIAKHYGKHGTSEQQKRFHRIEREQQRRAIEFWQAKQAAV